MLETLPNGKTKNWIVDRKGFFWSDGRVFDYLFGKETLQEAEAGIPYDKQFGIINQEVKKKKQQLREKHGVLWRYKMAAEEFGKDIKNWEVILPIQNQSIIKKTDNGKQLPKEIKLLPKK